MHLPLINITSQAKLLISLLIVSFMLMCLLAWQSYNSVVNQQKIANKVLTEYAHLAAEEYSRKIMADIGYRGYFNHLNLLRDIILTNEPNKEYRFSDCPTFGENSLVKSIFLLRQGRLSLFSNQCQALNGSTFIHEQLLEFDESVLVEKPFAFIHSHLDNEPLTIVVTKSSDKQLFGFIVNRQSLSQQLQASFNSSRLLPQALAQGKATNAMLNLVMSDHHGITLVGKAINNSPHPIATLELKNEYSGIFKGHTISVSIKSAYIEQLIIGGLPKSNLLFLLIMLLLLLIIFIVSFLLFHKESQLSLLRENFVAEVSHELRTPLAQIRMFAEMLLRNRVRNEEEKKHYLKVINRESLRLNHLVENILKYSQNKTVEEAQHSEQAIDQFIENIINEFQPICDDRQVKLVSKLTPCEVSVDSESLRRILLNLLDNAVKYGPEAQTILITGGLAPTDPKKPSSERTTYRIEISDQGPGIPANETTKIWQAYYRIPRENQSAIAGTGIGLFLVKQLADSIKASVRVENLLPSGSRFILELNLNKSNRAQ